MPKIMTSNIRVCSAPDTHYCWNNRRAACIDVIHRYAPDLIGFQEMRIEQFRDLHTAFPEYATFGTIDEENGHPLNQIFYRNDRYRLVEGKSYWLSETPDVLGSKSWASDCVRFANAILLEDQITGDCFRFVNTHLDHISQLAREKQAEVINREISQYPATLPHILSGDMNCDIINPAMQRLLGGGWKESYQVVHKVEEPGFTYHDFIGPAFDNSVFGKMDFIFYRGGISPKDATIIKDSVNGMFPSDHYFVTMDF